MPVNGLVDSMLLLSLIWCIMKETAIYSNAGSICKPNVRDITELNFSMGWTCSMSQRMLKVEV